MCLHEYGFHRPPHRSDQQQRYRAPPVYAYELRKSGLIFGRGDQPIQFVSVLDVAAVVSRAATDSTLRGQVLEIAGEPITMTELARALQNARRWPGSPRHLPRPLLSALSLLARPLNPAFARQNQTALAIDTGLLTVGAPAANAIDLPRQTLSDVLARFTAS